MSKTDIRALAVRLLLDYEENNKYANLLMSSHLTDKLTGTERAHLTRLVYTTLERRISYDYYIGAYTKQSVDKLSSYTRALLRIGICQILDMDNIPDYVAVNETVGLAKNKGERAFVNAILRRISAERDSLPMPDKEKNEVKYYSVKYSLPQPLIKYFMKMLSKSECIALFNSFLEAKPTTVSVNTMKISVEEYLDILKEKGYNATRVELSDISIAIYGAVVVRELPFYDEGYFIVQDTASAIATSLQARERGCVIIDTCSAPGGKSALAGILSQDEAEIYSFDIHESKLSLIESTINRLGLSSIKVGARDATNPDESLFGRADSVICDVPCSGLGVIAKKPDLRYKDLSSLEALPPLQLEILTKSSRYVKRGGEIIYSTCTLNREENECVIKAFLDANPDFYLAPIDTGRIKSECGYITLYPHIHNTDGFFIARLKRK